VAVGKTRAGQPGIPYLRRRIGFQIIRRLATTTVAVAALIVGITSAAPALGGYADAGLGLAGPNDVLLDVSPTGFAWRDGIRPGQVVVRIDDSNAPGGWALVTQDAGRMVTSREAPYDEALRMSLPLSIASLAFGGLALLFLRGRRSWTTAAASVGLVLAAPALVLYGKPEPSTITLALGASVPVVWLAWRPRVPVLAGIAGTVGLGVFIAAWALARLNADGAYDGLNTARDTIAFLGTALVVIVSIVLPVVRSDPIDLSRPRLSDLVAVGAVGAVSLALVSVFAVPVVVPGAAILGALLVLPTWRTTVGERAERLLLTDVREHAALEAAEAERAHLSRELHDAPLQELAGVIRRLEMLPDARAETTQLRAVAQQLRTMATELRPPVLDDLGLAAAIEFVAEMATSEETRVIVDLENLAGLDAATRPPTTVELAAFRIGQEAITNAMRHANATTIRVTGSVSPTCVDFEVADDGRGIADDAAVSAARRGRLGLASIRRRAQAIDADVTIEGSTGGTTVHLRWDA
jgi:signal transduction histidine kinase